ncbi:unnamed protein product [Ceutorhynchus assimilis]|uniref:Serine/threonine-protein phosphatase 4 regulatory subunit 2 n=1 Tax=Ceutorhynchus assimilis TaxID=467358 RepID=A0A9N9MKG2_9CUCU|nr:unnamed protein product [Ceutorhynchus assimilis]
MENSEEILHSLEEFSKMNPKDIPRELEEYLKFVAKNGDPIYPWAAIKRLLHEKLVSVITEFYESCSTIPPCPNVELFNYHIMKTLIVEKLDSFAAAPFTLQRICELLTNPRKQYTRVDKYMRALEKNILVVSTIEPGGRRTENGEGFMNGLDSDHDPVPEPAHEINVESMDDSPFMQTITETPYHNGTQKIEIDNPMDTFTTEKVAAEASTSNQELVCVQYVSIEPVADNTAQHSNEETKETDVSVTITAIKVNEDSQPIVEAEVILTEPALGGIEVFQEPIIETELKLEMDADPLSQPVQDSKLYIDDPKLYIDDPEINGIPIIEPTSTSTVIEKLLEEPTVSTSEAVSTSTPIEKDTETSISSSDDNLEKDDILKLIDNSFPTLQASDTKCEVTTTKDDNVFCGDELVAELASAESSTDVNEAPIVKTAKLNEEEKVVPESEDAITTKAMPEESSESQSDEKKDETTSEAILASDEIIDETKEALSTSDEKVDAISASDEIVEASSVAAEEKDEATSTSTEEKDVPVPMEIVPTPMEIVPATQEAEVAEEISTKEPEATELPVSETS